MGKRRRASSSQGSLPVARAKFLPPPGEPCGNSTPQHAACGDAAPAVPILHWYLWVQQHNSTLRALWDRACWQRGIKPREIQRVADDVVVFSCKGTEKKLLELYDLDFVNDRTFAVDGSVGRSAGTTRKQVAEDARRRQAAARRKAGNEAAEQPLGELPVWKKWFEYPAD
jgi:hypothetical protein